ncbi:hypothetical protein [Streptomyces sp. NPDC005507]|uniref:hypothetical protein n=1 Tax=unclassified Streptomyces TaxID=2593676 RepID=UPI0033B53E42
MPPKTPTCSRRSPRSSCSSPRWAAAAASSPTARPAPSNTRGCASSWSRPEDDGRVGAVRVSYELELPEGDMRADDAFARGVRLTHEKYCTVSRTVEHGARIEARLPDGTLVFMAG